MTKSSLRIIILVGLFMAAMICLFSEPVDEAKWFLYFFASKVVAAVCIWSLTKLYPRWSKTDKWIARYDAWSMKGLEE